MFEDSEMAQRQLQHQPQPLRQVTQEQLAQSLLCTHLPTLTAIVSVPFILGAPGQAGPAAIAHTLVVLVGTQAASFHTHAQAANATELVLDEYMMSLPFDRLQEYKLCNMCSLSEASVKF